MEDNTILSETHTFESVHMEMSRSKSSTGSDVRDEANATPDSTTEETSSSTAPPPPPPLPKSTYPAEQVEAIIKEVTEDVLSGEHYQHSRLAGWNAAIVERSLVKLGELKMSYKYIVTCVILQRTDAGIHAANACYWDNTRDGYITYKYESKSMYTIVNAFCLAV